MTRRWFYLDFGEFYSYWDGWLFSNVVERKARLWLDGILRLGYVYWLNEIF